MADNDNTPVPAILAALRDPNHARHLSSAAADEIERLQSICAEAYQAVGFLADRLGYWEMPVDHPAQAQITKLLDNLSAGADGEETPHADLLPFGWKV